MLVELLLENKSKIIPDSDMLDIISVVSTEVFPKGKTVLVLTERENNGNLGECIPRNLLKCAKGVPFSGALMM